MCKIPTKSSYFFTKSLLNIPRLRSRAVLSANMLTKLTAMFTIKYQHTVLVCLFFCMLQIRVGAQKQIAITIDDPTTKATPKLNWQERDSFILKALDHHNITAALFICGMRVDNSEGRVLMNNWDSKDYLMCNHSYSHLYYNSTTATA